MYVLLASYHEYLIMIVVVGNVTACIECKDILLRPYQFDFMFLRSLPEKLDMVGREITYYILHTK